MFNLFKKKKYAAMFVDFECWAYSLNNMHGIKPNIKAVYEQISEKYELKRIYFFGDFTEPSLRPYIDDIRSIGGEVVDTVNSNSMHKKDFTDVIMLDHIYQDIDDRPKTDVYVLFTGDGHFASVAAYLRNKKKKRVLVYGVKGSFSSKLYGVSDECVLVPADKDKMEIAKAAVIKNCDWIASRPRPMYPTFLKTVSSVAKYCNMDEDVVVAAVNELISDGIISQEVRKVSIKQSARILVVDWDRAREAGFWHGPIDNVIPKEVY